MAHRKTKQHTVNVVKAQFCAPENISYLDLFEGFNELYTINIATNIDFLANLLELFTKVEIIFGNLALCTIYFRKYICYAKKYFARII